MFVRTKVLCVRPPRRSDRTTWRSEDLPTERTDGQWDLTFRLYRRVIEIDDGRLLPRPYMRPATIVARSHLELLSHWRHAVGRIAGRFLNFEDLILHLAARPDLDILTNKVSERGAKTAKRH